MASKMADIQRQLERATGRPAAIATAAVGSTAPPAAPPEAVAPVRAAKPAPRPPSVKAPSREGKIHIGAYLHPDFKASLRLVQARTGKDIQALIADALNELFRTHNAPVVDQS
jgi:hypothetical protein